MKKQPKNEIDRAADALAKEFMERLVGEDIAVAGIALTLVLGWVIGHGSRGDKAEMQRLHDGTVLMLGEMLEEDLAR